MSEQIPVLDDTKWTGAEKGAFALGTVLWTLLTAAVGAFLGRRSAAVVQPPTPKPPVGPVNPIVPVIPVIPPIIPIIPKPPIPIIPVIPVTPDEPDEPDEPEQLIYEQPTPGRYYRVREGDNPTKVVIAAGLAVVGSAYKAMRVMRDHRENQWMRTADGTSMRFYRRFDSPGTYPSVFRSATSPSTVWPVIYIPTHAEVANG